MDYDEVFGNTAASAAATRPRGGAILRNKAGRKAGNLIQTPTASDADSMLDIFRCSDTPTPQQQPAHRKNQNQAMSNQHHHHHHHQPHQQRQQQQPKYRAREDESDDTRFSGSSDNDDDEHDQHNTNDRGKCHQRRGMEHEKQQLTRNNTRANKGNKSNPRRQNDDLPPLHSSDIINIDDDDDDDNDAAASGCKTFDGIRVDKCVNANGKAYIEDVVLKQKLGSNGDSSSRGDDEDDANNNAVSRKGAAANATDTAGGKKHYRGHHHGPSAMAQSLSPYRKKAYRIPKKSRPTTTDPLASRTNQLFADPLEEAQYRQEYNRPSAASYNDSNSHQHYRAENVNNFTGAAAASENRQRNTTNNSSRAGKNYSSQFRGNTTTATVPAAAATTTTARNGSQFIGGSMDTKRAAEAALRAEASRRSEKQQQQQQQHQKQQQHHQHHHQHQQQATEKIKSGVKRMIDAAVDLVSTPLKKLRSSSSSSSRPKEDEEDDGSDYNSTIAVDSVESHPNSRFADTNAMEEDHYYDGDDEVVDYVNTCGQQPVSYEEIQGITPKYTTPPDTELADDLENSQSSSASSCNLWGFGVKRAPQERAPTTKKKGLISEIVRRSTRKNVDTLDPSPNHNSRNNRENNSASQQQKRQRSQSSNTAAASKRTYGRRKKDMKDPNQRTCDTWLTKSTKQGAVFDDFDNNDEEFEFHGSYENSSKKRNTRLRRSSSSGTRSSLRLKGTKGKEADQVITIDSSDEGDDTSITTSPDGPKQILDQVLTRSKRAAGDVASIDAVRIAIGLKVFKTKCTLSFQFGTRSPYIQFSYQVDDQMKDHTVYLRHDDELKEVKYHIAPEDDTVEGVEVGDTVTVISFRITPSHTNNLTMYSKSYNQVEGGKDIAKNYISIEPRNTEDFQAMLEQMRQHDILGIWCTAESEFQYNDLEKYANALLEDSKKEEEERMQFARVTRSSGRRETKPKSADNNLLLVYPFDVDEAVLSGSAADFTELGGKMFGLEAGPPAQADGVGDKKMRPPRTHYITICEEDKNRLRPGQFLNDSLVDFWMRWISRGESQHPNSIVHFFTSHFMSTLKSEGLPAVASWTSNKNINVFDKKLIFIPINATLHWSLCVVVNPGLIANSFKGEESPHQKRSCILFFDSLRMHNKKTYAKLIRQWLNCEWKRLGKGKVGNITVPFDNRNMPLLTPKIPYQDNGCDCGVFVCRYAYNLFIMRNMDFTLDDISDSFNSSITRGVAFQFDQSDIPRIRKEFASLIDNLSEIYLPIRKDQDEAEKRAKDAEKRAKRIAKRKDSTVVDDQNRNVPETTASAPSRLDGRDVDEGNVAADESATVEKENDDGSNEIATLADNLSDLDFLVSKEKGDAKKEEQHSTKRHASTDVDEDKKEGDGNEENVAVDASASVDKSDSDGDTTVLCSSDSEEQHGATPSESFSDDEEVAEDRTTSMAL